MEYAEGGTLQDYLNDFDGGIPWDQAVAWLIPICDAVQAAHDQGILHRDIKPENILLETSGKPLLADFGIACLADEAEQTPVASMAHAAPEMFRGLPRTEQSDVFSLGTTFYLVLTGRPPFGWTQDDRLKRLDSGAPPVPENLGAPAWVSDVLARCLAPDPRDRIESAIELRKALLDGLGTLRVDLPTIPHAVLTPPSRPDRTVQAPDGDPVLVSHPSELLTIDAAAVWAPSQLLLEPSRDHRFRGLVSSVQSNRWTVAAAVATLVIGAIATVMVLALGGDEGTASGQVPTGGTGGGGQVDGEEGGDTQEAAVGAGGSGSGSSGLLAGYSDVDRLALINLPSFSSGSQPEPLDDERSGFLEAATIESATRLAPFSADLADRGLVAAHGAVFALLDDELESMLLLFDSAESAASYAEGLASATTQFVVAGGVPPDPPDGLELVRAGDAAIIGYAVVDRWVLTVSTGVPATESGEVVAAFAVTTAGGLLLERAGDVAAGRPPVAAWLVVDSGSAPFNDPAVVGSLERAMNDEAALEEIGGRVAVASFPGQPSVDPRELRAHLVPDQPYAPDNVGSLQLLGPIEAAERWWCSQSVMEESASCDEEALLYPFDIVTTSQTADVGLLVSAFLAEIESEGRVIEEAPNALGNRVLNSYYDALILPGT